MTQSDGGKEIHKFVKDSSEALKVSKVAANWKAYVDFVARLQSMSSLQLSDWLSLSFFIFTWMDHTYWMPFVDQEVLTSTLSLNATNISSLLDCFVPAFSSLSLSLHVLSLVSLMTLFLLSIFRVGRGEAVKCLFVDL